MERIGHYEVNGYILTVEIDSNGSETTIKGLLNGDRVITVYIDGEGKPNIGKNACFPSNFKMTEAQIRVNALAITEAHNIMQRFK